MKLIKLFSYIIGISLIAIISCKKENSNTLSTKEVEFILNHGLNKTWILDKMYINGDSIILTPGLANYKKTYKINYNWLDSDGYLGSYSLSSPKVMTEITTNLRTGSKTIIYNIKSCTTTELDVEYTLGSTTYRLVFKL